MIEDLVIIAAACWVEESFQGEVSPWFAEVTMAAERMAADVET